MFIFQLLPLEFHLLQCALGNGLIFFRSSSLELKLKQIDLGEAAPAALLAFASGPMELRTLPLGCFLPPTPRAP